MWEKSQWMNSINATLAVINLFILEWEAFMMLLLTVGVVIITTLIGTLITAELSESAHSWNVKVPLRHNNVAKGFFYAIKSAHSPPKIHWIFLVNILQYITQLTFGLVCIIDRV